MRNLRSIYISAYVLQRKYKTVQKMEGATQKSLDEEIKLNDESAAEPSVQKVKADDDSERVKSETQSTSALPLKKTAKAQTPEDNKEPTSSSATQNERINQTHDKDTVDSAETSTLASQSSECENPTVSRTNENGTKLNVWKIINFISLQVQLILLFQFQRQSPSLKML